MKKIIYLLSFLFLIVSCKDEKIEFTQKLFENKLALSNTQDSTIVVVNVPIASGETIVADSINNKIFSVVKNIIYLDEKPFTSIDYNELTLSFIASYNKFVKDFPNYHQPWEATVDGKVIYESEAVICIEINYYSFTGGAHGNGGLQSILIDAKTGKKIPNNSLFLNEKDFKAFAEKKFRLKYKIPENGSINATGLQFEEEKFQLPQNIFYTDKGLLLYYNQYEIASYADGTKELLLPYEEINSFLVFK